MKKLMVLCLLILSYNILFAQSTAEELMEKFREKIRVEEQQKLEETRKAEELRLEEEKRQAEESKKIEEARILKEKEAMTLIEERRREYEESLVEKVYRPGNDVDKQIKATDRAFVVGEQRVSFKRVDEQNILAEEKRKGIEKDHSKEFVSEKFDEVYEKYKASEEEIKMLLKQQEEIKANLRKVEEMERKIKE